jgi:hypothetical protein
VTYSVGEKLVVLRNDGNHRVVQGEGYLRDREKQGACNEIIQRNHGDTQNGQLEADVNFGQFGHEFRVHDHGGHNPDAEEHKHGGDLGVGEQDVSDDQGAARKDGSRLHAVDSIDHEGETQAQHHAAHDRLGRKPGYWSDDARKTREQPEEPRDETGAINGCRTDAACDSRCADGFHGLDGERRSVVEPRNHERYAEHEEKPERGYLHDGDVGNDKRDQGADVSKCPGPFHPVAEILRLYLGNPLVNLLNLVNFRTRFHDADPPGKSSFTMGSVSQNSFHGKYTRHSSRKRAYGPDCGHADYRAGRSISLK